MLTEASGQEQATHGPAAAVPLLGGDLGGGSGMELSAAAGSQGALVGAAGASGGVFPLAWVQPHLLQGLLAGAAGPDWRYLTYPH